MCNAIRLLGNMKKESFSSELLDERMDWYNWFFFLCFCDACRHIWTWHVVVYWLINCTLFVTFFICTAKNSTNYPKKIHSTQKSTKQSLFQVYTSSNTRNTTNIQTLHTLEINSKLVLFWPVCWLLQKLGYFWVVCWLFVKYIDTITTLNKVNSNNNIRKEYNNIDAQTHTSCSIIFRSFCTASCLLEYTWVLQMLPELYLSSF